MLHCMYRCSVVKKIFIDEACLHVLSKALGPVNFIIIGGIGP